MTWWAETGMIEARDMESSIGVKRASDEEDLVRGLKWNCVTEITGRRTPCGQSLAS